MNKEQKLLNKKESEKRVEHGAKVFKKHYKKVLKKKGIVLDALELEFNFDHKKKLAIPVEGTSSASQDFKAGGKTMFRIFYVMLADRRTNFWKKATNKYKGQRKDLEKRNVYKGEFFNRLFKYVFENTHVILANYEASMDDNVYTQADLIRKVQDKTVDYWKVPSNERQEYILNPTFSSYIIRSFHLLHNYGERLRQQSIEQKSYLYHVGKMMGTR